nr:retinitis pigmentosa 1-like 1 protein [Arvicanthis niloticus]
MDYDGRNPSGLAKILRRSCVFNMDSSSSSEEYTPQLMRKASCVVIDSDSDSLSLHEEKNTKICEISSGGESSDTDHPRGQKLPLVVIDDEDGNPGSRDSEQKSDECQMPVLEKEVVECIDSAPDSPHDVCEIWDLCGSSNQTSSDPDLEGELGCEGEPESKGEPESEPKGEPESAKGEPEPESAKGEPEPESAKGEPEPESSMGEPEPESAKGEPEPESAKGEPEPESAKGEPEPESAMGEPEPESAMGEPEPESAEGEPEPEFAEGEPEPEFAEGEPEPESAEGEPEPEFAEGEPEPEAAKGEPEQEITAEEAKEKRAAYLLAQQRKRKRKNRFICMSSSKPRRKRHRADPQDVPSLPSAPEKSTSDKPIPSAQPVNPPKGRALRKGRGKGAKARK